MKRYFFDLRDGDAVAVDEEGIELRSIAAAQEEAACSLAQMAMERAADEVRNRAHRMAIEVRDSDGPIMKVLFIFEADRRRQ
jgi:hypothetical protein